MLLALTLWQPWATVVIHHGKDIENRVWPPPKKILEEKPFIAIHAGRTFDHEGRDWCIQRGVPAEPIGDRVVPLGAILGVARVVGFTINTTSKWWIKGQYGWLLEEITSLEKPIPCSGAMGLWQVPSAIEAQIRSALADKISNLSIDPRQGRLL